MKVKDTRKTLFQIFLSPCSPYTRDIHKYNDMEKEREDEKQTTYLSVLSYTDVFESWPTVEFNFIDQDSDAPCVSCYLANGTTESWSLFLLREKKVPFRVEFTCSKLYETERRNERRKKNQNKNEKRKISSSSSFRLESVRDRHEWCENESCTHVHIQRGIRREKRRWYIKGHEKGHKEKLRQTASSGSEICSFIPLFKDSQEPGCAEPAGHVYLCVSSRTQLCVLTLETVSLSVHYVCTFFLPLLCMGRCVNVCLYSLSIHFLRRNRDHRMQRSVPRDGHRLLLFPVTFIR